MKKTNVMIHVIKHDMDHNMDLNYRRKIRPVSYQCLTNILTDSQYDSGPNDTSYVKVDFTEFIQNSISLNMGMIFFNL